MNCEWHIRAGHTYVFARIIFTKRIKRAVFLAQVQHVVISSVKSGSAVGEKADE